MIDSNGRNDQSARCSPPVVEFLAALSRFRLDFRSCLTARGDELFGLADAQRSGKFAISLREPATVNGMKAPVNQRGGIACQPRDEFGDLLGRTQPTDRVHVGKSLLHCLVHC